MLRLVLLSLLAVVTSSANAPHSTVQDLTDDTFEDAVFGDAANGLWFLKFYAPWCGHCKRMAPALEEVAPKIKGKMAIGKIDCTIYKSLCDKYKVKGFPTLKFARDGEIYDYPGGRGAEEIMDFAAKMSSPAISTVSSYEEAVNKMVDSETEVGFVVYHPQVSGATLEQQLQSTTLTQVAAQVARKRQATTHIYLFTGEDTSAFGVEAGKEFLVKIEDHVDSVQWEPKDGVHSAGLLEWIDEANVALVTEFGPNNFNRIGRKGRELVVGCVDGDNEEQVKKIRTDLANYASTGPKAIVDQYYFGWLDGKQWYKFLDQFDIEADKLPQFMVLNVPTKVFYQDENFKTIKSFLEGIDNGDIKPKDHPSHRGFVGKVHKLENWFFRNMPYSLVGLIVIAACMVIFLVPAADELRPPYPEYRQVMEAQQRETNGNGTEKAESKKDK